MCHVSGRVGSFALLSGSALQVGAGDERLKVCIYSYSTVLWRAKELNGLSIS